jgi:hypothetical protein
MTGPEQLKAIQALCVGVVEWRVSREDGAYCMSFSREDSLHPEQEARDWLESHQRDYPERFACYEVRSTVVQSQLQIAVSGLLDALSAQAATIAQLEEDARRLDFMCSKAPLRFIEGNDDMWRVYQDEAPAEACAHKWRAIVNPYFPTPREAIDAAIAAHGKDGAHDC